MNKKLKLTKLTVANLERVKGGDEPPVCLCKILPSGGTDEAGNQIGGPFQTLIKTICGGCGCG